MRDRAFRRHKDRTIKAKRSGYYGGYAKDDPTAAGKLLHTTTTCSNPMCCGNPRKLNRLTKQEICAIIDAEDEY